MEFLHMICERLGVVEQVCAQLPCILESFERHMQLLSDRMNTLSEVYNSLDLNSLTPASFERRSETKYDRELARQILLREDTQWFCMSDRQADLLRSNGFTVTRKYEDSDMHWVEHQK